LLGINGRGKTTVLQLIALGLTGTQRPLFESEWKNVIKDITKPANFEIILNYDNQDINFNFSIDKDDLIIKNIDNENITNLKNIFLVAYGTGRNGEQHNFPLNENFKNIATLFGINNLAFKNGEVSEYLNQRNSFLQIKKIITKIFNQAEELENRVELVSFDKITNNFYFKTPTNLDTEISLNSMSSGFRTSFQWILDFAIKIWKNGFDLEKPELITGIVLIDEIDTHLHIKWQRTILLSLNEVFKNIQFIVTTHSPFVVQSLENNNIIALQLDNNTNCVKIEQIANISGNSYESIINELFDEKSIFNVKIENLFNVFYQKRNEILRKEIDLKDDEFQKIVLNLRQKSEEVNNIVNRELRQISFLLQKNI